MTQLVGSDVARIALWVGVPRGQMVTCVAIAWAESGLRTDAIGENRDPNTHQVTSRDRGLWQINDYWHPDVSDACAFEPNCNGRAMYRISSGGTNWNPWSTFQNGAYRNYLKFAQIAVNYVLTGSGGVGGPAGGGGGGAGPPSTDAVDVAGQYIKNGGSPIAATAQLIQRLFDETMDQKYGPGHRTGPVFGGIIK